MAALLYPSLMLSACLFALAYCCAKLRDLLER